MSRRSDQAVVPRNGHTLVVGIGARISGCANQKEMSLDDQVNHAKEVVAEHGSGPVEFRIFQAKGRESNRSLPLLVSGVVMAEELTKDNDGVWHGKAQKDGSVTSVWLDYKGNVGATN